MKASASIVKTFLVAMAVVTALGVLLSLGSLGGAATEILSPEAKSESARMDAETYHYSEVNRSWRETAMPRLHSEEAAQAEQDIINKHLWERRVEQAKGIMRTVAWFGATASAASLALLAIILCLSVAAQSMSGALRRYREDRTREKNPLPVMQKLPGKGNHLLLSDGKGNYGMFDTRANSWIVLGADCLASDLGIIEATGAANAAMIAAIGDALEPFSRGPGSKAEERILELRDKLLP